MTELVAQARTAREKLAAALALLQDPEAGNLIDSVAEPVARAMGALHQVESSGGAKLAEKAPLALDAVRAALASLQSHPSSRIAEQAMEHIAGSLGLVHGLAEQAKHVAPAPAQPAARAGALDKTQMAPSAPAAVHMPSARPTPAPPGGALDATLPIPTRPPEYSSNPALDSTQASVRAPEPSFSATRPSAPGPEMARKASSRPARNSKMAPAPGGGKPADALEVEANLGAHSPTNFYKGLSGNDVVDDGGLFIATYDIPSIGTKLWLSVNMPGGYQFEALAEVRWTRESGVGDAPPGFGCAFKDITEEARKLVYRYVKNREPLFHDDL